MGLRDIDRLLQESYADAEHDESGSGTERLLEPAYWREESEEAANDGQ